MPADQNSARGALKVLAASLEAGDQEKILGVLHAANPLEQRMAKAMADMAAAVAKFRKNSTDAFGEAGARELVGEAPPAGQSDRLLDSATETVTADDAVVQLGAQNPPAKLKKVDGKWKFPVAELAQGVDPAALNQDVDFNMGQAAAINTIADEIAQKKFKTPVEVRTALETRLRELVDERRQAATAPSSGPAATAPAQPAPAPADESKAAPAPAPNQAAPTP